MDFYYLHQDVLKLFLNKDLSVVSHLKGRNTKNISHFPKSKLMHGFILWLNFILFFTYLPIFIKVYCAYE